jgi:dTDP-4-amino-4,6-dideoxygalactose transaminase
LIPITKPWLDEREAEAARRAILSGWVTQGPEVAAFEREFAAALGAPQACAVSSCTTALHLALLGAGVRPGDEVVTVSHSFIATASCIRYCGAIPVFVDIEPATFNLDPALVEAAFTPRTAALLVVHQLGMPCDLRALLEIARRHSIPAVEDAACAIGSQILWDGEWQPIGRPHADVACFSFHPRKLLTTGDGGMLTTRDAALDRKFRLWRQHGMDVSDASRHASRQVVFESYPELGYNYRMTDIQAAVGREQLKRLPGLVAERRNLAARYAELLAGIPGLGLPCEPAWARSNWQSFCVRLPEHCDQRAVMQRLLEAGVATRRGVMCVHREAAYPSHTWRAGSPLAQSERAQDHSILLPLFNGLTLAAQQSIADALRSASSCG